MLYFDHNATTPLIPQARDAWLEASERWPGNPSSPHRIGSRASWALEESRGRLAGLLGCSPADLFWTSGATESNNLLLHHFHRTLAPDREVWVSAVEHPSVLAPARRLFGDRLRLLPVTPEGVLDLESLRVAAGEAAPGLVAVMAANNETGVVQPWGSVLEWCRARGVPFFCDAAQWLGKMPASELREVTCLTGCAHKFGGPRGIGFLKFASPGPLRPLVVGGAQEEGARAGTENLPGALALVRALEVREAQCTAGFRADRLAERKAFEASLLARIPGCQVLGASADRLWNTVAVLMPQAGCDGRWVVRVDRAGCAVSTGSACSSGKEEPSHVLRAMGVPPGETGRMLRLSGGWETGPGDWSRLLESLVSAVAALPAPRVPAS
ncbi:MAG TPA: cysteine desulfurase [Verrucomicrobiales bacterium]|nr:cysteine desulfurase [Verrucomicrobiales bacterium]